MKHYLLAFGGLVILVACSTSSSTVGGSSSSSSSGGASSSSSGGASSSSSSGGTSSSSSSSSGSVGDAGRDGSTAGDGGVCAPPQGSDCPTTAGNCLGIGTPCTFLGGQCPKGLLCDKDLDPANGDGICISVDQCHPGAHECGTGASCCQNNDTQNHRICVPNTCLIGNCTAE